MEALEGAGPIHKLLLAGDRMMADGFGPTLDVFTALADSADIDVPEGVGWGFEPGLQDVHVPAVWAVGPPPDSFECVATCGVGSEPPPQFSWAAEYYTSCRGGGRVVKGGKNIEEAKRLILKNGGIVPQ